MTDRHWLVSWVPRYCEDIVDGVLESRAGSMGGLYAFGDELADFKAINTLGEGAVNLV